MKMNIHQVLPTKLHPPLLQKDIVLRSDLIYQLNQGLNRRCVLISAPAGFGKTTLINSWLAEQNLPFAWLSLDRADNDLSRFFSYLLSALAQIHPDFGLQTDEKIDFSSETSYESIFFSLIQDLEEYPTRVILVFDDYHVIHNPVIHEMMQFIIRNLTLLQSQPGGELRGILPILISRSDPPFSLSKWRMQNELVDIRMKDLRFSDENTRLFFQQEAGISISASQAKTITAHTEGWIAGLQLATISLREHQSENLDHFIEGFSGANHLVAEYLFHEVISALPQDRQKFLIKTSILERMSAEVCDEILSANNSRAILEEMKKATLFLIPLDDEGTWFRYHHLLLEYLCNRRIMLPKEVVNSLHVRAAGWFEQNDYLDECIQHYLAADKLDQAVRIIAENASPILNLGKMNYLRELIAYFPEKAFDLSPWLCIYRAWNDVIFGQPENQFWVNKAETLIQLNSDPSFVPPAEVDEMLGNIAAIRVMDASKIGKSKTAYELTPTALALLPPSTTKVRGLVMTSKGLCQMVDGDLDEAKITMGQAYAELINGRNFSGGVQSLGYIGQILYIQGKLHQAESVFKEAIAMNLHHGLDPNAGYDAFAGLGLVTYEWNRLDDAIDTMQLAVKRGSKMGVSSSVYTSAVLANVFINLGELEKARDVLEELDFILVRQSVQPHIESRWAGTWIKWYAASGQHRQALRLIEERRVTGIGDGEVYRELELLALGYYYQSIEDYPSGLNLLNLMADKLAAGGRNERLIKVLIMKASMLEASGNHAGALDSLIRALELSRLEGYLRSYLDAGNPILQLLMEIARTEPEKLPASLDVDYVTEIIHASLNQPKGWPVVSKTKPYSSIKKSLHVPILENPLTPPELNILRLLVSGYDNFEIASNQHLSINTVKTHISHIFSKLGVHNRVQASNRAKILGLV
jgi:LuxR family maltose regulon positive regulatory protein